MAARLKHRWSLSHNYLAGVTAGAWWRLLRENQFAVDPAYWHRAAFVTAASCINSLYAARERRRYDAAVAKVEITEPPLFILGHWRSGTTLLHYLLAQDTSQFAYANTYQVVNPLTFLSTEAVNTKRFAALIPKTRPMDNMALSFDAPQEDEFAPLLMCLKSLYLGASFPRREDHYARYLTFDGASPDEIDQWKSAFLWFCKKLTFKYGRALLLKSPAHTARIRLLLELFPDARFVHIHRHPYEVFQSQRHYFDTAMWYTYLQRPELYGLDERILRRYTAMFDAFFADRPLIPAGRFHEIRFDDLAQHPLEEMARLYSALDLTGFAQAEPKFAAYIETLHGYEKNKFPPLSTDTRRLINNAWCRSFETWNYAMTPEDASDDHNRDRRQTPRPRPARNLVVGQPG
jgi:hypothetical protein